MEGYRSDFAGFLLAEGKKKKQKTIRRKQKSNSVDLKELDQLMQE